LAIRIVNFQPVDVIHSPSKGLVQRLSCQLVVARALERPEAACGAGARVRSCDILVDVLRRGGLVDVDSTLERCYGLVQDQLPYLVQSFRLGLDQRDSLVDLSPALRSVAPLLRLVGVELSSASKALPRLHG